MFRKHIFKVFTVFAILLFSAVWAWTHSGRTDKYGGHYNRKTGTYHYHNSGTVQRSTTPSKPTVSTATPKTVTVDIVEFQNLKNQILKLTTEVNQLKWQVKDLHFMTETLRIPIVDKDEGHFYYAKTNHGLWGMLPSEAISAETFYLIGSASQLGYSKDKIKELNDEFKRTWRNPFLNPYEEKYNVIEANYHPDAKKYFEK